MYDDKLPPLPVPNLDHTLDKYLESTKPYVTDQQFENTRQLVENFKNGIGAELHEKLKAKAATERNWVRIDAV